MPATVDPVCSCIESCLKGLEKLGTVRLRKRHEDGEIHLAFGAYSVHAVSYEIALVRLAMALLDDARFCHAMKSALESQMPKDDCTGGAGDI